MVDNVILKVFNLCYFENQILSYWTNSHLIDFFFKFLMFNFILEEVGKFVNCNRLYFSTSLQVTLRNAAASGSSPTPLLGRQVYQPMSFLYTGEITSLPSGYTDNRLSLYVNTLRLLKYHRYVMLFGNAAAPQSNWIFCPSRVVRFDGARRI